MLERLCEKIRNKEFTCLIAADELIYSSGRFGILPLVEFFELPIWKELNQPLTLADKLLGKGGALFIIEMNIFSTVFASVMTDEAYKLLTKHGITVSYDQRVPHILNRTKSDLCPIEKIAKDATIDTFDEYYQQILTFYREIKQL